MRSNTSATAATGTPTSSAVRFASRISDRRRARGQSRIVRPQPAGEVMHVLVVAAAQAEAVVPRRHVAAVDEYVNLTEQVGDPGPRRTRAQGREAVSGEADQGQLPAPAGVPCQLGES